ncbi:MAG: hypothetical protein A2086_06730 [Spirochaetes bacterium GWD1_27_9]|nr:MAG: hypothetical protein A2Y34_10225 [Spirochaetes bacterium GWC1_27_15]OHD41334.1 MAG: hypothetical protein A2086_06730 [Spirochaetes bacterium GWD1_27_9]
MPFDSINIKNFRGINNLSINNIKKVNLITGRNNCGKTSVLEAIFLLCGMSNPELPVTIHNFRDFLFLKDDDFSLLFHNLDFEIIPEIEGKLDNKQRQLKISPIYPQQININRNEIKQAPNTLLDQLILNMSNSGIDKIDGLKLNIKIENEKKGDSEIRFKQGLVNLNTQYKEKISATYLNSKTIMIGLDKRFDFIVKNKNLDNIMPILKEIEPKLVDLRMGATGMIYADIGIDKLIPINIMGDGLRRILAILSAILQKDSNILIIDEIENGLHYTSLEVLWRAIFKLANDTNVQIFCTTHSYECVESFAKVNKDYFADNDDIRLFRIDRKDDNHNAFCYDKETLSLGIEKGFEVR